RRRRGVAPMATPPAPSRAPAGPRAARAKAVPKATVHSRVPPPRGTMPSLWIEVGGQRVVARLPDAPVRVGRDAGCDLRIDHPAVSSAHLQIEPLPGGGHKLVDLNSGLPTRVNGLVVKRVSLKPGDVVEIGPARLVYDPEAAPAGRRPAAAPPPAPSPSD